MLQYDELCVQCQSLWPKIEELGRAVDAKALGKRIKDLETKASAPDFWSNTEKSQKTLQEISFYKGKINNYNGLVSLYKDTLEFINLANETKDLTVYADALNELKKVQKELESQLIEILLSGEYDSKNAIVTLHAGAGGTEAQDWVEMLYRMYLKWAERNSYKIKLLDFLDGETTRKWKKIL